MLFASTNSVEQLQASKKEGEIFLYYARVEFYYYGFLSCSTILVRALPRLWCLHITRCTKCIRRFTLPCCFYFNISSLITLIHGETVEWDTPMSTPTNSNWLIKSALLLLSPYALDFGCLVTNNDLSTIFYCDGSKRHDRETDNNVSENLNSALNEGHSITDHLAIFVYRHFRTLPLWQPAPACSMYSVHSCGVYDYYYPQKKLNVTIYTRINKKSDKRSYLSCYTNNIVGSPHFQASFKYQTSFIAATLFVFFIFNMFGP